MINRKAIQIKLAGRHSLRTSRGSGIVEGTVGLVMIISGAVLATLLMVNAGIATYYKEKLGFITIQGATYAANSVASGADNDTVTSSTKAQILQLAKALGLPDTVTTDVTVSSSDVTVSVQISGLKLIGNGQTLPTFISLNDSTTALIDNTKPRFAVAVSVLQGNTGVDYFVPAYGVRSHVNNQYANGIGDAGPAGEQGTESLPVPLKAVVSSSGFASISSSSKGYQNSVNTPANSSYYN